MTKKFIRLVICMLIAFVSYSAVATAESGVCGDSATWEYDEATCTLTIDGMGKMDDYEIYTTPWKAYHLYVKNLVIKDGITRIGDYAFYEFVALESVKIPGSVEVIGPNAFEICSELKKVEFSEGLRTIARDAFYWCNKLTSIDIPASVSNIGSWSFEGCVSLEEINVDEDNETYCSADGVVYSKDSTEIVIYPNGKKNDAYTFPEGVSKIAEGAFENNKYLKAVYISDGVTVIPDSAFHSCEALERIEIPDGVQEIGDWAFAYCEKLVSIDLPAGLKKIGYSAFEYDTSLAYINIPEGLEEIDDWAFVDCDGITWFEIPASVRVIGEDVFSDCDNLVVIAVDQENENYCSYGFCLYSKDKTTLYAYPAGLDYKIADVHEDVTEIASGAFCGNDILMTVNLPEGLTKIGADAFYDCKGLEWLVIPESVSDIGYYAFDECTNLKEITIPPGVEELTDDMFWECEALEVVNVPCAWKNEEHIMNGFTFDDNNPDVKYMHTISDCVVEAENKLSFTCTACGESDSVTLEAPENNVYTGKPIKPVVITENNSAVVIDYWTSDFIFGGRVINPGECKAEVKIGDAEIFVEYEIMPAYAESIGEFADNVTIERRTEYEGNVLVITPKESVVIPDMMAYAVVYDSDGNIVSVDMTICSPDDETGVLIAPWEAPVTEEDEYYKLMLWNAEIAPMINAE